MQAVYIFLVAFLLRTMLGYLFYGSIDVGAFMSINAHTFDGTLVQHPFTIWCAFPIIPFYLWLSGLLAIKTSLPIAFCFKVIPIIFDSLLAVLVFDFVRQINPARALQAGFLYACCPLALMITCIHGQWDGLPILFFLLSLFVRDFYQDSYKKYFLYGALFAFSFLLKPISLIFLLFFFIPWHNLKQTLGVWWTYLWILIGIKLALLVGFFAFFKLNKAYSIDMFADWMSSFLSPIVIGGLGLLAGLMCLIVLQRKPWQYFSIDFRTYLSYQVASILGLCAMVAFCFALLGLYGFNLIRVVDKVLRYCNQGIAVFGLPFGYPFSEGILNTVLKNRFWIMALIALIAVCYYNLKIDVYHGVLASLLIIFSFSGLSPQYLIWAMPLFLITGMYRSAALFNSLIMVFLVFYYMNPFSNPEVLYQSMLSFAPLKGFSWLLPPASLADQSFIPFIHLLGNYLLPLFCFCTAGMIVFGSTKIILRYCTQPLTVCSIYVSFSLVLSVVIACLMAVTDTSGFGPVFHNAIAYKMTWYDTHLIGSYVSGNYGQFHPCNIVVLLLVLTLVWGIVTWRMGQAE